MAQKSPKTQKENNSLPKEAKILSIKNYTPDIKLYTLKFKNLADQVNFKFIPGQFIFVYLPEFGEAPLGIASSPEKLDSFTICVRKVGTVTSALDNLRSSDAVGIRGPYGNGFPLNELFGKDIIVAAGGTGIVPIASLIEYLIAHRKRFGKINFLYGAKTPTDLLFRDKYKNWSKYIKIFLTVDTPDKKWKENCGLITTLCSKVETDIKKTAVIMCGPPPMYQALISEFNKLHIKNNQIYVSLERRMRCGIGKCQHCVVGKKYVCLDGPVFRLDEVEEF